MQNSDNIITWPQAKLRQRPQAKFQTTASKIQTTASKIQTTQLGLRQKFRQRPQKFIQHNLASKILKLKLIYAGLRQNFRQQPQAKLFRQLTLLCQLPKHSDMTRFCRPPKHSDNGLRKFRQWLCSASFPKIRSNMTSAGFSLGSTRKMTSFLAFSYRK